MKMNRFFLDNARKFSYNLTVAAAVFLLMR